MYLAYVIVTVLAVAANFYAATNDFRPAGWTLANMTRLGVSNQWLIPLGALKAAGAIGLLAGIVIPLFGLAAAAGLTLYFLGAIATTVRARWYAHLPYPTAWLILAVAALALRLVTFDTAFSSVSF
jgi:hypothetical protein